MDFIWYEKISNSDLIEQGDLIPNCPIIIPPSSLIEYAEVELEVTLINSIVLSQSCDLRNNKIQIALVCPYIFLKDFVENLDDRNPKSVKKTIDNLKKGHMPGYHLLNKSIENDISDFIVVDFRNVYGIHINSLKSLISNIDNRQRLLPPYREHLSQSFARFFMRVGLPQDIEIEGY